MQGNSRKLTNHIHERASKILRDVITPNMFHDEVTNQVLFDEILIINGNYLCIKYTENHLKNHIRAQLRLLGRFMIYIKKHDESIQNCKELIHSKHIDTVRKAIDDIAELDQITNIYKHPTNARTILTELKKIVQIVKSESDKTEDLMQKAKGFNRRIKQELAPYINRVCKHSENKIKRLKHIKCHQLPQNEVIGKYLDGLNKIIAVNIKELQNNFSLPAWATLNKSLMVYLAAFNRKRPGETQRLEVVDFNNREGINSTDISCLDESERNQANKYERISFRGQLGNSTALLVDKVKILPGIKLILKYRKDALVHPQNRFLFASKGSSNATFDAYRSHREFCQILGVTNENLTFTKLRKQFATEVAKKGVSEEDEKRCSTYMSHDFNIHKNIYDHSATLTDITKVSKHLESTMRERPSTSYKSQASTKVINRKKINADKRKSVVFYGSTSDEDSFNMVKRKLHKNERSQINKKRKLKVNKNECVHNLNKSPHFGKVRNTSDNNDSFLTNSSLSSENVEPTLDEVEHCLGMCKLLFVY